VASIQRVVKVFIECSELPPADWGGHDEIWIGIQEGQEVVQRVQLPADSVVFEAELRIGNNESEPNPNFLGPFAHGGKEARFMYVCWGRPRFGGWSGFRRAKLPLAGLSWDAIESNTVRGKLRCTDSKGGPICATVKADHFAWVL
jgi:Family of unknown function (DUF5990)